MLDEQSQKTLDQILAKHDYELSDMEKAILRARRDYLSDQDRSRFANILEEKQDEAPVVVNAGQVPLKRPALMKEAKKLGLKVDTSFTAPQLKAMIDNYHFEKEAEDEEALMKKEERESLEEQAKALKIGFGSDATNEELIELIREAQADKATDTPDEVK